MNSYGNKLYNDEDEHGYDNLCKYSIEKCELCDMVFSSRFANIIHTSQHIIIPLIKQKIHQCKKCLYCFTLKSDLKAHKQAKHKKIDGDGETGQETSQTGQETSQTGQESSQIGYEGSQIDHKGSQIDHKESQTIIDHKKSPTGKKKRQNSPKKSQSDQNESKKSPNKSENEKDALLRSIIMKQPIVKVDNIANLVAKTLFATKNDEKHSKLQNDTKLLEKDCSKTQKDKSNKDKGDAKTQKDKKIDEKESFKTKKVIKDKNPTEIIFSSNRTSQMTITEVVPNKIIIGGKKPMKRKSPDKIDNSMSKRDKKSTNTETNKSEGDRNSDVAVANGIHTTDLTHQPLNRYRIDYRAISPDVISINSDSSKEPSPETYLPVATQSKRSLIAFTHDEDQTVPQKDQSKPVLLKNQSQTVQQKEQSKILQQKDQSKTIPQKDQSKTPLQKNQSKIVPPKDQSKTVSHKNQSGTVQKKELSKTIPQKDQSQTIHQNDWSKNITQTNQLLPNIPFVITDSDNELDANIDELLNNITSPIKKSNFRSKIQFEDDENIKLLDLELTNLTYEFKSVHYDELVEPELSECRRCHMIFMNKLSLYQHEPTHMRVKRTKKHYFCKHCENYYAGNHITQKKHYEKVHNTAVDKKRVFPCPVCKLQYYKLKEHYKKYHPNLICRKCLTCFGTETVFNQHSCSKTTKLNMFILDSKMTQKEVDVLLLVCELCLSFKKTTANFKYEVVGEKCEVGTRQKCFYCAKEFFEVKVVKRINFMTMAKNQNLKLKSESDWKVGESKKKGQVSNAEKLQIIKKRLKAMKK